MSELPHTPHWGKSRSIQRRIVITGTLTLLTPAHFGNGDAEGITDLSLIRDPLEGRALLTGATITGALRNYLWEWEWGYQTQYDEKVHKNALAIQLFGGTHRDPNGEQSALIIDDALGEYPLLELRDGVRIDPVTRTAEDDMKYDIELLRVGTTFPLRFELLVAENEKSDYAERLQFALATALTGLETAGEIGLGSRKRRGYGECQVTEWTVTDYDLTTTDGLLAWLTNRGQPKTSGSIHTLLPLEATQVEMPIDQRHALHIRADFWLDGSLLVRSGTGEQASGPDTMHLHRLQRDSDQRTPVLPGTSVAGALRHRTLRIAKLIHPEDGSALVNQLFGSDPKHYHAKNGEGPEAEASKSQKRRPYRGSKISVRETVIQEARTLIQHRIRIDRFTGGVLDNYLFDEAPLFGGAGSLVQLDLTVRNPTQGEVGLILLLLKDLWTADLALGGGANVGRGRLRGIVAHCRLQQGATATETWEIKQQWEGRQAGILQVAPLVRDRMESFVIALQQAGNVYHAPAAVQVTVVVEEETPHA